MVMRQLIPLLIGMIAFIAVIGPLVWERTLDPCRAFDRALARGDRPGDAELTAWDLDIAREVRAWYVQTHLYMPVWSACTWGYWRMTIRARLLSDATGPGRRA